MQSPSPDPYDLELQDALTRAASEDPTLYEMFSLGELDRDEFLRLFRARED